MEGPSPLQRQAQWLGWLGLLPFLGGTLLLTIGINEPWVVEGLRNYAAIILTFVGAIHWGRALQLNRTGLILFSVWPSLYAWACLFLPVEQGLLLLALGFLLLLLVDQQLYRASAWFRRLRIQLSLSVSGLLLLGWSITA
ncbi:MAG: DUF3429 domain-containing protein [Candidatus Thiodiazotropha sp.]